MWRGWRGHLVRWFLYLGKGRASAAKVKERLRQHTCAHLVPICLNPQPFLREKNSAKGDYELTEVARPYLAAISLILPH